jgi:hypothetical protein
MNNVIYTNTIDGKTIYSELGKQVVNKWILNRVQQQENLLVMPNFLVLKLGCSELFTVATAVIFVIIYKALSN